MMNDRRADVCLGGEGAQQSSDARRETVRFLTLAIAQLQASLRQGDASVSILTRAFTVLADGLRAIVARTELGREGGAQAATIQSICADLSEEVTAAVIAFQFYDRLTQELTHVSGYLSGLATLIADPARGEASAEWESLRAEVRSRYTMESERRLFDGLLGGVAVQEVLAFGDPAAVSSGQAGEVELF